MIAIVDYGVGNLFSLKSSLKVLNIDSTVTSDTKVLKEADKIILPGVGAFRDAKLKLDGTGLTSQIVDLARNGKPLLGICLGMQLLFDRSFEYGETKGFGLIHGDICSLDDDLKGNFKVPQMGWNSLKFKKNSPLLKYTKDGDFVYFVHSYYGKNCEDSLVATVGYGVDVTAIVQNKNIYGTQFHPEKSGEVGLKMLKAFSEVA